jgi:hypothetical protein
VVVPANTRGASKLKVKDVKQYLPTVKADRSANPPFVFGERGKKCEQNL